MKHGNRARRFFMVLIIAAAALSVFSFIVMTLWNAILPAAIHVSTITFWQALGILVLSKILFGGFHGGWRGGKWRADMHEKWKNMTPEQKELFKQQLRTRCGPWKNSRMEEPATEQTNPAQ